MVPVTTVPAPAGANDRWSEEIDQTIERLSKLRNAEVRWRGHRDDLGLLQKRALDVFLEIEERELEKFVIDLIHLGQSDDTVFDSQEIENAQVLFRLRFPPFGRRNDEQTSLDSADAGQHVAQEADVSGHIDERQLTARR
jgi:hypothetical protein